MRVRHQAKVAPEPKPGAIVTAPGPLLCDIEAELAAGALPRRRDVLHEHAVQLLDEVHAAVTDEAHALCEHDDLDFEHVTGTPDVTTASVADAPLPEASDKPVIIRHRFAEPRDGADANPRRIIVLRDRRMGRPPRSPRHGADPPV